MDELVERSLRAAALWDEVKDKLHAERLSTFGRAAAAPVHCPRDRHRPDIILMDEPCSALDPIATLKIEELMRELIKRYTIIIVTHNMQQAGRVADYTAFFTVNPQRTGYLVEFGVTRQIFTMPKSKITEDYITGRFG